MGFESRRPAKRDSACFSQRSDHDALATAAAKDLDPDDLEDCARISTTCLRVFIKEFITWFGTRIFSEQVQLPDAHQLKHSLEVFRKLGTPGALGESDGVHLAWDACPADSRAKCTGKEQYPTVAFNVTCLASREIIFVSEWCGGATNDKTQARHDQLFAKLRRGEFHPDVTYQLYDAHGVSHDVKGLYLIVDSGYLEWRCLQAPLKHAAGDESARWSERIEISDVSAPSIPSASASSIAARISLRFASSSRRLKPTDD